MERSRRDEQVEFLNEFRSNVVECGESVLSHSLAFVDLTLSSYVGNVFLANLVLLKR